MTVKFKTNNKMTIDSSGKISLKDLCRYLIQARGHGTINIQREYSLNIYTNIPCCRVHTCLVYKYEPRGVAKLRYKVIYF